MSPEMAQMLGNGPSLSILEMSIYLIGIFMIVVMLLTSLAVMSLPVFYTAIAFLDLGVREFSNWPDPIGKLATLFGLVFRNMRRNLVRTSLTYVALFVLTGMLTMIYSLVYTLDQITKEKEGAIQVIMTERFSIPSMMPRGYSERMRQILTKELPPEYRPDLSKDVMTWSFVGGFLDPEKKTKENGLFILALEPHTILTMLDYQGLNKNDLSEQDYAGLVAAVSEMQKDKKNIIVGKDRLQTIGKQIGDTITLYPVNYKGMNLDLKIVGTFPEASRWGNSAVMRMDYLNVSMDQWKDAPKDFRSLNLVWVRLPNRQAYETLAEIVNNPKTFSAPQVKLETASAGISSMLDSYKDILWGMKFIVMPAIMTIMCLVVGITITISVRERRTEMAVLKVLGFQPWQVTLMIIAEAVLIGVFGGMLSTWLVYFGPAVIEYFKTLIGLKVQIAFFNNFKPPIAIVIYGPLLGVLVGLAGSVAPSISSQRIKLADVFAQVT